MRLGWLFTRTGMLWSVPLLLATWGVVRLVAGETADSLPPPPATSAVAPAASAAAQLPAAIPATLPRARPIRIEIPQIRLRAKVDEVGLAADGTIETPSYADADNAAWYRLGASPGEPGAAVILGHVDSKKSLAVFFYLRKLQPGAQVEIARADGTTVVYAVDSVEQFVRQDFPTERVYAPDEVQPDSTGSLLRLVTCGGRYDKDRKEYDSNVIVFAHMVGTRSA